MFPGFIPGSRATLMLDVVAVAMFVILPIMTWSIAAARYRRRYRAHKRAQWTLGVLLLVAVTLFEVDIRAFGWRHLAEPSPYYQTILFPVLYVHLFFSVSTTLLWTATILLALKRFPSEPLPSAHSATHRRLGWMSAIFMSITAVTGWTFYYMAFLA